MTPQILLRSDQSLEASCAPSTERSSCANTPGISATAAAVSVGAMYSVGWQLVAWHRFDKLSQDTKH